MNSPIKHLVIKSVVRDAPLSKAILAEVGTKAKHSEEIKTILIPIHSLFLGLFINLAIKDLSVM